MHCTLHNTHVLVDTVFINFISYGSAIAYICPDSRNTILNKSNMKCECGA